MRGGIYTGSGDGAESCFFNILTFGRTDEVISEHMDKGRFIGSDEWGEGEMQEDNLPF